MLLAAALLATGCIAKFEPVEVASVQPDERVAIIPGCPSEDDGRLSLCQRQRASWAAHLFEQGLIDAAIPSGGAVYTRYGEAQGIARGLVALGVPPERIHPETQARHTDQNVGYSLPIIEQLGYRKVLPAADRSQAGWMCSMATNWADVDCLDVRWDGDAIDPEDPRLLAVRTPAEPGWRKVVDPPSGFRYWAMFLTSLSGRKPPVPSPPVPEPTFGRWASDYYAESSAAESQASR